ncbi:MAG: hypothetical protein ACOZAO_01945 [Patescibacteria group bacterium]
MTLLLYILVAFFLVRFFVWFYLQTLIAELEKIVEDINENFSPYYWEAIKNYHLHAEAGEKALKRAFRDIDDIDEAATQAFGYHIKQLRSLSDVRFYIKSEAKARKLQKQGTSLYVKALPCAAFLHLGSYGGKLTDYFVRRKITNVGYYKNQMGSYLIAAEQFRGSLIVNDIKWYQALAMLESRLAALKAAKIFFII